MNTWHATISVIALAVASITGAAAATQPMLLAQRTQQDLKGIERAGQRDDMTPVTAAQQAQYKAEYQAPKAKWASLTPQEKAATTAAARNKKLSDLSMIELVGQRDDMKSETAAQTAQYKAEAEAAKAKWDKLTPAEKQAVRKSSWQKKRAELNGMEAVGQRDDSYVLPYLS
jgi:hypothetical protein